MFTRMNVQQQERLEIDGVDTWNEDHFQRYKHIYCGLAVKSYS